MNKNSAAIAAEIDSLRADLLKVTDVIPIVGIAAVRKANDITAQIETANEQYAAALAAEVMQAREERLSQFSDISVTIDYPPNCAGNLLRAGFIIQYTKAEYDMRARCAIPRPHKCDGFAALPDDAFEYLVHRRPEAIPAEILALAPGEPQLAFAKYSQAKRRGRL